MRDDQNGKGAGTSCPHNVEFDRQYSNRNKLTPSERNAIFEDLRTLKFLRMMRLS